jgi:hypothetical protein
MKKFKISEEAFKKHKKYYNNQFDKYDNEIYQDIKTRLVHLDNFSERNWFNKRYNLLFKKYPLFDYIVEVGFGLPYLYLRTEKERLNELPSLIYVDIYESALKVSKEIIKNLGRNADFIKGDIEEEETWDLIKEKINGKTLLVGIEVLEHLKNPNYFWENAKKLNPSKIIISLPIGPKISSHHSFFLTEKKARDYLEKYIIIEDENIIKPLNKSKRSINEYKDIIVYGKLK